MIFKQKTAPYIRYKARFLCGRLPIRCVFVSELLVESFESLLESPSFSETEISLFDGAIAQKVEVNQEHRILKAHAELKEYVSFSHIQALEDKVKSIYTLNSVEIIPTFEGVAFEANHWPDIVECAKRKNGGVNGFLNDSTIEMNDSQLTVFLKYGGLDIINALGVEKKD